MTDASKYMLIVDRDVDDDQLVADCEKKILDLCTAAGDSDLYPAVLEYVGEVKRAIGLHSVSSETLRLLLIPAKDVPRDSVDARETAEQTYENYHAALTRVHTEGSDESSLMAIFAVLVEFGCPEILLGPLRDSLFAHVNALPDAERAAFIGMDGDKYDEGTEMIRRIAYARTEDLIPAATGEYRVPTEDEEKEKKFAWPEPNIDDDNED